MNEQPGLLQLRTANGVAVDAADPMFGGPENLSAEMLNREYPTDLWTLAGWIVCALRPRDEKDKDLYFAMDGRTAALFAKHKSVYDCGKEGGPYGIPVKILDDSQAEAARKEGPLWRKP